MLTTVGGAFVKIAFAHEIDIVLAQGLPHRPAARFNRRGQDALYLSPDAISANVAIGEYIKPDDPPRVLLRLELTRCNLYDLRHPSAAPLYALAGRPWQSALDAGFEPSSWHAADRLRADGHIGLIDPSRRRPGVWHITLFCWNEAGGPLVTLLDEAQPINAVPDLR